MNTADATRLALQRATILDEIADSSSCVKAADVARMAAAMLRELARTAQTQEARLRKVEALPKWAVPRGYASHEPTRSLSDVVPMIREDDLRAALAAEPAEEAHRVG